MKNKVLKIVTVIILLATLTMANFIYVGYGLVSYAASSIATNHQNVEFDLTLFYYLQFCLYIDYFAVCQ